MLCQFFCTMKSKLGTYADEKKPRDPRMCMHNLYIHFT